MQSNQDHAVQPVLAALLLYAAAVKSSRDPALLSGDACKEITNVTRDYN